MRKMFKIVLALTLISTFAPAVNAAARKKVSIVSCPVLYKKWDRTGRKWAAFAQNKSIRGGNVCGWGEDYQSKRAAVSAALSECRAMHAEHPTWGVKNTCRIKKIK
jgi:hypothetical protein